MVGKNQRAERSAATNPRHRCLRGRRSGYQSGAQSPGMTGVFGGIGATEILKSGLTCALGGPEGSNGGAASNAIEPWAPRSGSVVIVQPCRQGRRVRVTPG